MSTIRVFAGRVYRFIRAKLNFARPPTVLMRKAPIFRVPRVPKGRPQQSASRLFGRIWNRLYASARVTPRWANLRSGFAATWVRGRHMHMPVVGAGFYFAGFQDAKVDNVFSRIREYFVNESNLYDYTNLPRTLSGYEIGSHIAKGCNAVVYEARIKTPSVTGTFSSNTSKMIRTLTQPAEKQVDKTLFESQRHFPLAIKMMFNYETLSNEETIVREMGGELVPCTSSQIKPFLKWHKSMNNEHSNIVKIFTAFVDVVPMLPGAEKLYPAALPSALYGEGVGRNSTLFLVMKRYTMTLREYLLLHNVPVRTGQVLFGQLLEALAYLQETKISHRDLKSNNILVDFDEDGEPPRLVLADFGCCLSRGNFHVQYPHPDVDLGGNMALRPPEIVRSQFGERVYLDFSKADLWSAGTLALEIFTKNNPFYANPTLNETYREQELPVLNDPVPRSVGKLVKQMLKIDPDQRPTPICAANVAALSLFGINYLQQLLSRIGLRVDFGGKKWMEFRVNLADAISLYAVETLLGRLPESNRRISKAEAALRTAFLSRIDVPYLVDAIQYFDYKT